MLRALAFLAASLCVVVPSMAQDQPPLVQAINKAGWNPATRGPLLVVAPEVSSSTADTSAGGIPDITASFERKLVKVGSISVLVPQQMTVINTKPGKIDPRQLNPNQALNRLLHSLSESQWKLLGSTGIVQDDLTEAQRPYLERIFDPNSHGTIRYQETPGRTQSVPAGFLTSARLKMAAVPQLDVPIIQAGKSRRLDIYPSTTEPMGAVATVEIEPVRSQERGTIAGMRLSSQVPEKAKPGELDFRVLNQQLILPAGQTTVRELMASLSQATSLELYADKRLEDRTVWCFTEANKPVLAGDVLRALSRSITGTYRRLDNLYVLTDDLIGLGSRLGLASLWLQEQLAQDAPISWRKWFPYVGIQSIEGVAITEADREKIRKGESFPTSVLSEKWGHTYLQTDMQDVDLDATQPLKCNMYVALFAEVPGAGTVKLGNLTPRVTRLVVKPINKEAAKPVTLRPGSAILLRATTPDEAKQAVELVASRKIKTLFLEISGESVKQEEIAQAAGKAATEKKVSLKLVLSTLLEPDAEESRNDIDLLGNIGPWLDIQNSANQSQIATRLKSMAKTKGVAGIVLRDFRAPGYSLDDMETAEIPSDFQRTAIPYGFSLRNRLEVLRKFHIDPIDLGSMTAFYSEPPLFHRLNSNEAEKWRTERSTEALKLLEKELGQKPDWLGSGYLMPGKLVRRPFRPNPFLEDSYDPELLPVGSGARLAYWLRENGAETRALLLELSDTPAEQWEKLLQGVIGS